MTLVFDTLELPSGAPICRAAVSITLAVPSFDHTEQVTFLKTFYAYTADAASETPGYWSVDLDPNDSLDPDGTYYIFGYPGGLKLTAVVPDSGSGLWLRDLLVDVPAVPSSIVAGVRSIVAGSNITVDDSDPLNPVISAAGGGTGGFDPTTIPVTAVSSVNQVHAYPYPPDVRLVDAAGNRVDIGYDYPDSSHVAISFPTPFTGTIVLS